MASEQIQLDYAPPRHLSRKWIIRTAIILALVACIALLIRNWPAISTRVAYWRVQRRCLLYTAPPDQVVFSTRSAEAKAMQHRPGGYHGVYIPGRFDIAGFEPPELTRFIRFDHQVLYDTPRHNVAFMHERTSPAGHRRLIIISADATGGGRIFGFWRTVLEPVPMFSGRRHSFGAMMPGMFESDGDFRVFAGQVDPNDASHFTIRFELAGQPGLIDGRLKDNDRIVLTVREGPPANVVGENAQQE